MSIHSLSFIGYEWFQLNKTLKGPNPDAYSHLQSWLTAALKHHYQEWNTFQSLHSVHREGGEARVHCPFPAVFDFFSMAAFYQRQHKGMAELSSPQHFKASAQGFSCLMLSSQETWKWKAQESQPALYTSKKREIGNVAFNPMRASHTPDDIARHCGRWEELKRLVYFS